MQWCVKQVSQQREMHTYKPSIGSVNVQSWQSAAIQWLAPVASRLKLNIDTSVYAGTSNFAVGMVLRDHLGGFIKVWNFRSDEEVIVFKADNWRVLEALRWIHVLGVTSVDVECDSMLAVQAINKGILNYLDVVTMLQECRSIPSVCHDVFISFVKK